MPDGHIDDISASNLGLHRPAHDLVAKQKHNQAVQQRARHNEQHGLRYLNHLDSPAQTAFTSVLTARQCLFRNIGNLEGYFRRPDRAPASHAGLFAITAIRSCNIAIEANAVAVCFSMPSVTQNTSAATTAI